MTGKYPRLSSTKNLRMVASLGTLLTLLVLSGIIADLRPNAYSNGQSASLILGQTTFTSNSSGTTQTSLFQPGGLVTDASGNLWVADLTNSRILEFRAPFSTGECTSLVLGEPNFTANTNPCSGTTTTVNPSCLTYPESLAFDSSGNLWATDTGNGRILEFTTPFKNYENASIVIGEANFTASSGPNPKPTQSTLKSPLGIAFDSVGNLWVADTGNYRVLEFTTPLSTGEGAALVIGQSNFAAGSLSTPSGQSATVLRSPKDVTFDSAGNLWVADSGDNRVVKFNPPFSTGQSASAVLGQPDLMTSLGDLCTQQGCFYDPEYISFDSAGVLWVADTGNWRVMSFNPPFSNGENASLVLGQPDFVTVVPSSGTAPATQSSVISPDGIGFDKSGNLWVSDFGNNRLLEFAQGASGTSSTVTTTSSSPGLSASSASATSQSVLTSSSSPIASSTAGQTTSLSSSSSISLNYVAVIAVVVFIMTATFALDYRSKPEGNRG